jgi:alpha-acetolactate decarboxylase
MVALDGRYFQLDLDGNARAVGDDLKTPFSTVCRFQPTLTERNLGPLSWEAFSAQLKTILPSTTCSRPSTCADGSGRC